MNDTPSSPRITFLSWGCIGIEGDSFKDAKLYPGGAREWDWRESGTRHVPGIQPVDVEELLDHGAAVVVLSKGMQERLQVCLDTMEMLAARQIPTHVLPTQDAARLYNELCETERVGGLFHTTC